MNRPFFSILVTTMIATVTCGDAAEFVEMGDGLLPRGISADGRVVVGNTTDSDTKEAFIWSRETGLQMLGFPPGNLQSMARGVSADGSVVLGHAWGSAPGEFFLWTDDTGILELGNLPGFEATTYASISDDASTVVGFGYEPAGSRRFTALRWTDDTGTVSLLPDGASQSTAHGVSSDGKVVVGSVTTDGDTWDGFIWDEANGFQSLGAKPIGWSDIDPWLVSAGGDVVFGDDGVGGESGRPFRWTREEGLQPLPFLSGDRDHANLYDLSPSGSIMIGGFCGGGDCRAFVWDEQHGTRDLRDVLIEDHGFADHELPNLWQATGLSADAKTIIGSTQDAFRNPDAWVVYLDKPLVAVPEPGGFISWGVASLALWLASRRRQDRSGY
jgi:uncharacterized membrane protein